MLVCLAFHIERDGQQSAQGLLCRADIPEATASVAQALPAYMASGRRDILRAIDRQRDKPATYGLNVPDRQ